MQQDCLLFRSSVAVTDEICVVIPTVGEILENEEGYFSTVTMLTSMPIDMMVQLDDLGIDFATINDFELFLICFNALKQMDTKLVLGNLDLKQYMMAVSPQDNEFFLINKETGSRIDRRVYTALSDTIRKIHHLEKDVRKPANKEAREFMIRRAREKQRRRAAEVQSSQLEPLIVALVNTPEFSYRYNEVRDMTIYQFNQSLHQIIHKVDYNNRMYGVYAGTINAKELNQDDMNWLIHK